MKIANVVIPPGLRVKDQLEALPSDEVFSAAEISPRLGIVDTSLRRLAHKLPANCIRLGTINYFGSAKAIKAFKVHHKLP